MEEAEANAKGRKLNFKNFPCFQQSKSNFFISQQWHCLADTDLFR